MTTRRKGKAAGDAAHTAHSANNPAAEAGLSADIINIPQNIVQANLKGKPTEIQDTLLWAMGYARRELDKSRSRMCDTFRFDWADIFAVYSGKANRELLRQFVARARDVRKYVFASMGDGGLNHTVVTRQIWRLLDYALRGDEDEDRGYIVLISGTTGRSKSISAEEWARHNNHGRAVPFECPPMGGQKAFLRALAEPLGINKAKNKDAMQDAVTGAIGRRNILLIDEIERILPKTPTGSKGQLEYIRYLHDKKRCAVAILLTRWATQQMTVNALGTWLEQFLGRIDRTLEIPDKPMVTEIREILSEHTQSPSDELVQYCHNTACSLGGNLRLFYKLLRKARKLSTAKNEPLSSAHFAAAINHRNGQFAWPNDEEV